MRISWHSRCCSIATRSCRRRQFDFLRGQLGAERAGLVARYYQEIADLGEVYRLPLLEIAFPALKLSPTPQLEFLLDLGRRLIQLDGRISYREFCYFRILSRTLAQAVDPSAPISSRRAPKSAVPPRRNRIDSTARRPGT